MTRVWEARGQGGRASRCFFLAPGLALCWGLETTVAKTLVGEERMLVENSRRRRSQAQPSPAIQGGHHYPLLGVGALPHYGVS